MALNWYIDAWAPTEGLVFASQREQSEDPWVRDSARPVTTFAIAAPNFEAQPVDRSLAFGAVRRGFQERFSVGGGVEFGFESLAQLITFARRIYSGSGPGTMGGGGGAPPPEPGPAPEGEGEGGAGVGGAPDWFASQLLDVEMHGGLPGGGELLDTMGDTPPAERRGVFKRSVTPQLRMAASRLLIECAVEAAASSSFQDACRLVRAAACFASSFDELDSLRSLALTRDDRIAAFLARNFEWYHFRGVMFQEPARPQLVEVTHAPIPARFLRALGLPSSVRTMLDVLSYIAADRSYVVRSSPGLLPLLLAVAANFRTHAAGFVWYDEKTDTQSIDRLSDECSRFIADWLPVEKLPDELEEEIRAWCWRSPADQRS